MKETPYYFYYKCSYCDYMSKTFQGVYISDGMISSDIDMTGESCAICSIGELIEYEED